MSLSRPELAHVECAVPPFAARPDTDISHPHRRMAYWDWSPQPGGSPTHVVVCVHGLSRQGRDFDVLATRLARHARVVCPDVAGRGYSDWLADPMAYQIPTYVQDLAALLATLRAQGAITIDWVGTSMGGLLGMLLASQTALGIRKLVLNDVGPTIEPQALMRIGTYLGNGKHFATLAEGVAYLREISEGFGHHSWEQWHALSEPMFREKDGRWHLHYDPAMAVPFKALNEQTAADSAAQGQAMLWQMYDAIQCPTLLIRGQTSDLLLSHTAQAMTERGPKARWVDIENVGHAPTFVPTDQVDLVEDFLFGSE